MQPIEINGLYGEGGGSMLRQSLGLSLVTGIPFTMTNIRAERKQPGLKAQHLTALNAAHQVSNAQITGNHLGSTHITFVPEELIEKRFSFDIGTAGSTTLFLQTFLMPTLFSGKLVDISVKGGTDVQWSPSFDYYIYVLLPQLRKYGNISLTLQKRGFYPKGGGEVRLTGKGFFPLGKRAQPITRIQKGTLFKINGLSVAANGLKKGKVAERIAEAAQTILNNTKAPIDILSSYVPTLSDGSNITLWATYGDNEGIAPDPVVLGISVLGEKKIRSEQVGEEAAQTLIRLINETAPTDEHLADQLIPLLGIVGGTMRVSAITDHLRSNVYVTETFLGVEFSINEEEKEITCKGMSSIF